MVHVGVRKGGARKEGQRKDPRSRQSTKVKIKYKHGSIAANAKREAKPICGLEGRELKGWESWLAVVAPQTIGLSRDGYGVSA